MKATHVKIKAELKNGCGKVNLSGWIYVNDMPAVLRNKKIYEKDPQYSKVYLVYSVPERSKKQQLNLLVGQNIRQIAGSRRSCRTRMPALIEFLRKPDNRFPKDYMVLNAALALDHAMHIIAEAEDTLRTFLHEANKEQVNETAQP